MGRVGKPLNLEALQQTTREGNASSVMESDNSRKVRSGDDGDSAGVKECVFKQPFVLLRKLEESDHTSSNASRSEFVVPALPPLPALPAKPGKGWRRSIAVRARAVSLNLIFG